MHTPEIFIAYAPRGAGLRCAVACLGAGRDVYGWFTGAQPDADIASRCFLLEDYYSSRETRYESVDLADLHSAWSLDEARRHELASMQEAFAHEWLFHRDDARAAAEQRAYEDAALAAGGAVNVRFEHSVLRHLAKRWPLEFRPDYEPAASP